MIEIKKKPCKGIGKAKSVTGCGKETYARKWGLCSDCLHDFLFTTDAGKLEFSKISLQAKKTVIVKEKKKDQELRKKLDGVKSLKKDLEKEVNAIARLIDSGSGCISCGGQTTPQAGHYHTVQSNGSLRYNLHNLHLQDYNCNCEKSGNIHEYDLGLMNRYGREYWEYVKFQIVKEYPLVKLTATEYEDAIQKARQIKKELQSNPMTYTATNRIFLRNKINKRLGIYKEFNYI
jgi:hypothetical protein